jgi:hypothetical protein
MGNTRGEMMKRELPSKPSSKKSLIGSKEDTSEREEERKKSSKNFKLKSKPTS